MTNLLLALEILLFISVFIFINKLIKYKVIESVSKSIVNKTETEYEKRKAEIEELRIIEGNFKETRFINKLDLLLERSGAKKRFKFLNAEIYIIINLILSCIGFIVGLFALNYWLIGAIIAFFITIIMYGILLFFQDKNYKKTDEEMITFLNLLGNFSSADDDIVQIIGKTCKYLDNPLREYLMDFYDEVSATGNTMNAFRKLELKIQNEKLSSFIRNIEICSRHEANYREIIDDARRSIQDYLRAKQQRKAIIQNGKIEIFTCIVINIATLFIFKSITPNILSILKDNLIGNIILAYNAVVLCTLAWNMITFDKN